MNSDGHGNNSHSDPWCQICTSDPNKRSFHNRETIHSGHFMISNVPQDDEDEGTDSLYEEGDPEEEQTSNEESGSKTPTMIAEDVKRILRPVSGGSQGKRGSSQRHSVAAGGSGSYGGMRVRSNSDPMAEDAAGTRSRVNITHKKEKVIDSSLSKLFECMTLAYKAKLTSPKWNNFKGLKLRWTIKIRLNNVIWRAWHMQFIKQMRPLIAPFAIEVDSAPHNKTEAVVLEGKYWKRRLSMVSAEYRKWRVWYKDKTVQTPAANMSAMEYDAALAASIEGAAGGMGSNWFQSSSSNDFEPMNIDDWNFFPDFLSHLTSQPFPFPDPREIAQAGNADFIQPGLLQLQPSLDDLMDTLEPLSEYFASQGQSGGYGNFFQTGQREQQSGTSDSLGMFQENSWRSPTVSELLTMPSPSRGTRTMPPPPAPPPRPSQPSSYGFGAYQVSSNYYGNTLQSQTAPNAPSSTNTRLGSLLVSTPEQAPSYSAPHNISPDNLQTVSDLELRKQEMRQRSMSGPTPGQPLIDPSVFSALQNYNRSVSSSNGNVANQQQQSFGGEGSGVVQTAPPVEKFAAPQASSRGRRGKGARSSAQQRLNVESVSAAVAAPNPSETSTLAQLLTSGTSVFAGNSGGSMTATPPAKKLAPKPAPVAPPVIVSPEQHKSRSVSVTSFPSAAPLPLPISHVPLSSPNLSAFDSNDSSNGISRLEHVIPKLESFNHDSSSLRLKLEDDKGCSRNPESRRINHITAEQKRRGHIKSGFEVLHGLVPSLAHNPAAKVSKAVVLHKGAEYIHQLKEERRAMQAEAEKLKSQIESINQAVIVCQQQLPATGAPVSSRARNDRLNEMLDEYIRTRTLQNWKFWLFSLIMRPLFDNYSSIVSSRCVEELCQTAVSWVDQQCTLVQLRPLIKESMRKLSTSTHVLSDPSRLAEEARQAVQGKTSSYSSATSSSGAASTSTGTSPYS